VIVKAKATPWFKRYGLTTDDLRSLRATEGWHFRYGGSAEAVGSGEWGY
jgi:tagatose 1,6-diphosphate aldolase